MSWERLLSIAAEVAEYRRVDTSTPPQACPNDGEPLDPAPGGGLHCRFDGYRWPEDSAVRR